MGSKRSSHQDRAKKAREEGFALVDKHPLFKPMSLRSRREAYFLDESASASLWCRAALDGSIEYHPKRVGDPAEWAWALAHCYVHLGMGHHDPELTADRGAGPLVRDLAHDAACCVVVNQLLDALRIGKPIPGKIEYPSGNEQSLAREWRRDGIPPLYQGIGAAGMGADLIGTGKGHIDRRTGRPVMEVRFAEGLAEAVAAAVHRAGQAPGAFGEVAKKQPWDLARSWFISSYPLLGGIASGFTLVADADLAREHQIAIAAVDASLGEIYLNPFANLSSREWVFVLAHEMLHAGLRHGPRSLGRDPYLWNIAADFVVNGWLVELQVGDIPDGLLYDPELKGLSVDSVYERIVVDARRFRKLATIRGKNLSDMLDESLPRPREGFTAIDLDEFYRRGLTTGLAHHQSAGRGLLPAGLVQEIRVLDQPPLAWDVALARWFEEHVRSVEPVRTYARASRRQAASPEIIRPGRRYPELAEHRSTFGVVLDTSGSMDTKTLGKALGAIASYAAARNVPAARVIFCDAVAYDVGYLPVEDIAGRVTIRGRGGTVLQPGVNLLENDDDFPKDGPILIITDGECDRLRITREHAFLLPPGGSLPFHARGPIFRVV